MSEALTRSLSRLRLAHLLQQPARPSLQDQSLDAALVRGRPEFFQRLPRLFLAPAVKVVQHDDQNATHGRNLVAEQLCVVARLAKLIEVGAGKMAARFFNQLVVLWLKLRTDVDQAVALHLQNDLWNHSDL